MSEWSMSFGQIEGLTERQFQMLLTRAIERKKRESAPRRHGGQSSGGNRGKPYNEKRTMSLRAFIEKDSGRKMEF